MDTEKQAEVGRLHVQMRQATDSLHTQAEEVYEVAKKIEDLTKDTEAWYATTRARVEARATLEQVEELRRVLEDLGEKPRGGVP